LSTLSEKEITLLNQLSFDSALISQRELARKSGVSIGLVNMVLRKLIYQGYVRARALNQKRIRYFLTPKGGIEIMQRSYQKITRTISQYHILEYKIQNLISQLVEQGHTKFTLYGDGDFLKVVEICLKKDYAKPIEVLKNKNGDENSIVLNLTGKPMKTKGQVFNLSDYLSKNFLK